MLAQSQGTSQTLRLRRWLLHPHFLLLNDFSEHRTDLRPIEDIDLDGKDRFSERLLKGTGGIRCFRFGADKHEIEI